MARIRLVDYPGIADLRYLSDDWDRHDNHRIYVRKNGRKIRLREKPGTDEFLHEYREALKATAAPVMQEQKFAPPAPGSFRWACIEYCKSARFKTLKASTQQVRKLILDSIAETKGDKPVARMEKKHVVQIRDEKADFPEAANGRLKALRQLFKWLVEDAEQVERNIPADVPYLKSQGEGFHPWTVQEVEQYLDFHGGTSNAGRALGVLLFTGAARCDAVQFGRQHVREGNLRFRREKTSVPIDIPVLAELQAIIDGTPAGQLHFIVTEFGRPFTANGFGNRMRKWCDAAGLHHCSAHGLRKAGATIAANNGASAHTLMSIFGWKTIKQAEHYTRSADRKRLAGEGMHRLSVDDIRNRFVPLSEPVASSGTISQRK